MTSRPEDMQEYCTTCSTDLEIGQIGRCDDCQDTPLLTNHYLCPCGERWEDAWDCCCNDHCPRCHKEIEPFISDDGTLSSEEIEIACQRVYRNMRGASESPTNAEARA